jgi:hypothetical protein
MPEVGITRNDLAAGMPVQAPLQPLQDNLELQTYETFERDLTKYTQYEEAVLACLRERVPEAEAASRETVLMVWGCLPELPVPGAFVPCCCLTG